MVLKAWNVIGVLGARSNTTLRILSVKGGLEQNQVFFEQKTQFLALFEEFFGGKVRKGGEGGTPQIRNFFGENFVRKGGGGVPSLWTKSAK